MTQQKNNYMYYSANICYECEASIILCVDDVEEQYLYLKSAFIFLFCCLLHPYRAGQPKMASIIGVGDVVEPHI